MSGQRIYCKILKSNNKRAEKIKQLQAELKSLKERFCFKGETTDQVSHRWIIVKKPNHVPYVIKPLKNTHRGIVEMLKENREHHPLSETIVVELAYGMQLWVESGKNVLSEDDEANQSKLKTPAEGWQWRVRNGL